MALGGLVQDLVLTERAGRSTGSIRDGLLPDKETRWPYCDTWLQSRAVTSKCDEVLEKIQVL